MRSGLGYSLIIIAILIIVFTFAPLAKEEVSYQLRRANPEVSQEIIPIDKGFGLVIPKLAINVKVIKNVDPFNPGEYQLALTKGVAHAKGTSLPGEDGNIFIFSHSSQNFLEALKFNSVFYLLNKLEKGDEIKVYYNDTPHIYHVSEKKIVDPNEVSYLNPDSPNNTITLMTCYPPGTDIKRFIIVAQ